ncbi:calpain-1 catalytic subunit-like [Erpetoichthys calabaricus]|uniref:Calpain-1 catalytic subunit-like n=1 Tax=Erpetoichthys calabaricus TaxID=27687 RepID=A0A8C4RNX1_ERPCA|nr:calpain-1 catalytic subunit-like [Erpetoichthys calabaricus]
MSCTHNNHQETYTMPSPGICQKMLKNQQIEDGLGTIASPMKFFDQDFHVLRDACLLQNTRFVDKTFPPVMETIGPGLVTPEQMTRIEWIRPIILHPDPQLIVKTTSRFDIAQGSVGNCWFLAALGSLTFHPNILTQIIPGEQGFKNMYAGIFHFKFWYFGKWVDVVIDDKLPILDGKYLCVSPKTLNEFWPPLLEKAYAKLCGSYTNMQHGSISEALLDFTGGVQMTIKLNNPPEDLWSIMRKATEMNSLIGCGSSPGATKENTVLENGLVEGHAYSVTGVYELKSFDVDVKLIRLWNPWGNTEWNGAWSDQSSKWKGVHEEQKQKLYLKREDGEFWMDIEDFKNYFDTVNICNESPGFLDSNANSIWTESTGSGKWIRGISASGCLTNSDSFWMNPQYRISLEDASDLESSYNVVISLIQKPLHRKRCLSSFLHIGFYIFRVPSQFNSGRLPQEFFTSFNHHVSTFGFLNARNISERYTLPPGNYVVVPSTYNKGQEGKFVLSVFSKTKNNIQEVDSNLNLNLKFPKQVANISEVSTYEKLFAKYSQDEEIDAVHLQSLLNDVFLRGKTSTGGFSFETCKSMIAVMDHSSTGRLNLYEFKCLWKRLIILQNIFNEKDITLTGFLSLSELWQAIQSTGIKISNELLILISLRYGNPDDKIALENFISLMLRLECMADIFKKLSRGNVMSLQQSEWMNITMYL